MPLVQSAERYTPADDLWVVTCYFNPCGFKSRFSNYLVFADVMRRSGLHWLTVECAFEEGSFVLPQGPEVLRIKGRDVMWQKERLLNIAAGHLPPECRKVAWLDCDILFANADWAVETSRLLEHYAVVQLFDEVIRLPRGKRSCHFGGERWRSFGTVYGGYPQLLLGGDFERHGHTGFAWAARRELVARFGLYDACIAGSGDHMMAHALCGDWTGPCVARIIGSINQGSRNRHWEHFACWGRSVYQEVRAAVSYVPGTILHLWHGETADRRYAARNRDLAGFDFDPMEDLKIGPGGCWEWNSAKPALHQWALDYFGHRREDGTLEDAGFFGSCRRLLWGSPEIK